MFGIPFADRAVRSAAIATAISLAILLSLGFWQIQRLHWKEHILADIDKAESSPPVKLGANPPPFAKVVARGLLLPGTALYGDDVRQLPDGQSKMGAQRLQILLRGREPPLLVDLGWVQDGAKRPAPTVGPTQVLGYIRMADRPGALSAEDDVQHRHFYTLDPARISASLGVHHAAPFTLIAMGAMEAPGDPIAATELPRPPNNHLQYAFTWFGLAAAMVGVFVVWAHGRGKPGRRSDLLVPLALPAPAHNSPDPAA